jgi:hypothetical protein
VGDARITDPMFSIDWHFLTSKGQLESARKGTYPIFASRPSDSVLRRVHACEAENGVRPYFGDAILVLQGPPGTGKTRLIRAVLGEISRRNGGEAQVMYTGDMRALESDEIFVKFITGWDRAFVIEDADHLLRPRAHGNEHLHRFLAIADGVVPAQGRKVIFSTNLPNVWDLDDALVRPGRCFARVYVRELTLAEATALVEVITGGDAGLAGAATRAGRGRAEDALAGPCVPGLRRRLSGGLESRVGRPISPPPDAGRGRPAHPQSWRPRRCIARYFPATSSRSLTGCSAS